MTAVKPIEKENLPATMPSDTGTVLNLIARAASDPNCDIDKMERLMRMHTEMTNRVCEQEFNAAMRAAQEEMRPIVKDSNNPQTRSRYASYPALDRAIRPIYTKHGFALSFDSGDAPKPEEVRVLCHVSHSGEDPSRGFTRVYHVDMPADGKGAKGGDVMTRTHAAGSAYTYGQRYLLKLIFNLATSDTATNDDGNAAAKTVVPRINESQAATLKKAIETCGIGFEKFCNFYGISSFDLLSADRYEEAMEACRSYYKKQKDKAAGKKK
jgi:hypothetical protein